LTPEQIASIPDLLVELRSRTKVAEKLGVTETAIRHHFNKLPLEVRERVEMDRRGAFLSDIFEVTAACVARIRETPDAIEKMSIREVIGCFKIFSDQYRAYTAKIEEKGGAGMDAADKWQADAAIRARQMAIEHFIKTGDKTMLEQFMPQPVPEPQRAS
jgi:hypothetical protein